MKQSFSFGVPNSSSNTTDIFDLNIDLPLTAMEYLDLTVPFYSYIICWKINLRELLNKLANCKKNLCVISENYITLALTSNENKNYFTGIQRSIKMSKGATKSANK